MMAMFLWCREWGRGEGVGGREGGPSLRKLTVVLACNRKGYRSSLSPKGFDWGLGIEKLETFFEIFTRTGSLFF